MRWLDIHVANIPILVVADAKPSLNKLISLYTASSLTSTNKLLD